MEIDHPHDRIETHPPEILEPSEYHVRGKTQPTDKLKKSVRNVGIVHPPLARLEDGSPKLIDGVQRTIAAEHADRHEIEILILDLSETDALAYSLNANIDLWQKSVSDADEEKSLNYLRTGERTRITDQYRVTTVEERLLGIKHELGILTDTEVFTQSFSDVDGIGPETAKRLANAFDNPDEVWGAETDELTGIPGIGPVIADRLQSSDAEDTIVVEVNTELA